MSVPTSTPIHYNFYDNDDAVTSVVQPYQVLEVRLRFFFRLIAGLSDQILYESTPIPQQDALFPLPLHELHDNPELFQIYVVQLLSSLNIHAAACEAIAQPIASSILQMAAENREMNFHAIAIVDYIQLTCTEPIPGLYTESTMLGTVVEGTVVFEEAPPAMKKVKMEKLEEIIGENLGNCSICLDEFDCNKRDVVKIPCNHIYHKSCILKWINNNNSCPLCRMPLPLED